MLPQLQQQRHHQYGVIPAGSALDDEDTDDETADVDGTLRTGNERFRRGSRHLSRLSSTLGEGITAHWKRSQSGSAESKSPAATEPAEKASHPGQGVQTASAPSMHRQALSNDKAGRNEPSPTSLPPSAGLPDVHAETRKSEAVKVGETLPAIEQAKRLAAYRAVDVHVKPHHRVIGIGSGSTVPYVVDRLLEQGEEANRKRWVSRA